MGAGVLVMVQGESLVGGNAELTRCMEDWGYRGQPGGGILKDAVCMWQKAYEIEIDAHCRQIHGQPLNINGNIGPASARVFNGRFCNVSDFAATEEARWPDECVNEIMVAWNFDTLPGATKEETDAAWESLSQYEQLFFLSCPRRPDLYGDARINAKLQRLPGSTLANSNLANNNCGYRVRQNYDSTTSWSSRILRIGTIRHEVGHAFGLVHTPRDRKSVMYPQMAGQWELNQTDINQMVLRGYKRRTEPPPGPEPDPPGPDGPKVTATVRVGSSTYELAQENGGGGGNPFWPV